MKKLKKLVMGLTAAFALCLAFANVISVQAYDSPHWENKVYINMTTNASNNYVNNTKIRTGLFSSTTFRVYFPEGQDVTNIKSNKKGLEVARTAYYSKSKTYNVWDAATKSYKDETFNLGYATISLYATKAGSYKVTFNVGSSKYTVNVLASASGVYTKATLGKTKLYANSAKVKNGELTQTITNTEKVSVKKGKLKFTAGSQYKITGFVVRYVDKNGKEQIKKYKNGKNIVLSQGYNYSSKYSDGSYSKSAKKYTYVYVSYKDKFTGSSVTYSVSKSRGKKEVKMVSKNGITKKSTTSYSPYATLELWSY